MGAVGFGYRNEILDRHGVQHLTTKTLGRNAGAYALARRIHCSSRAGRSAADNQYIVGFARAEFLRATRIGPGIDRKSVVSGKSVSVRVDLGGSSVIKRKKEYTSIEDVYIIKPTRAIQTNN